MNDSHAYLKPHLESYWDGGQEVFRNAGGYAYVAGLFEQIRQESKTVIAFDNGDTVHGTFPAIKSKGESLVPILNELAFSAMTLHWEFAYTPEQVHKLGEKLKYPLLACNIYNRQTRQLAFQPYSIINLADLRVGVVGVASNIVDKTMPPAFSKGLYFTTGNQELSAIISQLHEKERTDLVIVLSHLGLPQDLRIAEEINGIDIYLSGHTHNRLYEPIIINGTILIQSGSQGSFIGRLDIEVDNGHVKNFQHTLISVDESIKPNPDVADMIEKTLEPDQDMLSAEVGQTNTPLARNRVMESTMDNFLLQGLMDSANSELAFSNGWRYGAPIKPGPITMNDLWNIVPVNPPVSTCAITGASLLEMMEENLEHTFSKDPFQQMGGYVKRCLGLNIYFKVENPKGRRIQEFYVNGKKLDKNRTYSACFITEQGIPEKYAKNKQNLNINAIDALRQYLAKSKTISVELKGTIIPI